MNDCAVELLPISRDAFGRLTLEIDLAENVAGERPGGSSCADDMRIRALEARLPSLQPQTVADWEWLARRLARAVENGWGDAAVAPFVRAAGGASGEW